MQILNRSEMKNIKGGIGDCGGQCLWCNTPNGFEAWSRTNDQDTSPGAATSQCDGIYPAYGGDVNGIYADCGAGEEHAVVAPVNC